MTYQRKFEIGAVFAVVCAALFAVFIFTSHKAEANPLGFSCSSQTGNATTTNAFMTPGTATSTLLFDTYCVTGTNQQNTGNTFVASDLNLLTQLQASSTATVLNITAEYSQDGIDWYQDNYVATVSTTTVTSNYVSDISTPNSYKWTFASSTTGGVATANNNRIGKVIHLHVPTRFVRIVYTLASGSTNGTIWGSLLPIKENK